MPPQIKIQQTESKEKLWLVTAQRMVLLEGGYDACEFMDGLPWQMSGFLLWNSIQMQRH